MDQHIPGHISDADRERSATASGLPELVEALQPLIDLPVRRMLDVGCGFGGLSKFIGGQLGADEVHGVDSDSSVVPEAQSKGVLAQQVDVETTDFPFPDDHFDFVSSLGMLDYLPTFDPVLREIRRVLRPEGHVLISLPNLASWHNRMALLLGYQPRDVEISDALLVGALPYYNHDAPSGHIHTATVRAFTELMAFHGLEPVRVTGASFMTRSAPRLLIAVDRLLSRRPTLARRFFFLGRKAATTSGRQACRGWWKGRS